MRKLGLAFIASLVAGAVLGAATAGERIMATGCTVSVLDAGVGSSADDTDCVWADGDRLSFQCDGGIAYSKDGTTPAAGTHPLISAGDPYPFTAQRASSTNPLKVRPTVGATVGCSVFVSDRQ